MNPLVVIDNLQVHFQARKGLMSSVPVKALDGVSLDLNEGETVAIVGESGSGKTTLGRSILRLVDPNGGRILFRNENIIALNRLQLSHFRKSVQGVFQDPYSSINPFMSIGQILEEPLIIHDIGTSESRKAMTLKALQDVNLLPAKDISTKYPHMLSGGQRQRVGLARALILTPDLIVADEPVSMVDASSRAEILYLMRSLQKSYGITFLYITHDIATALHFSDRIAVMYGGKIVEVGESTSVISQPLHPYTQALIRAIPNPAPSNRLRQRSVVSGEPASAIDPPSGCRFHPRCPNIMIGICELTAPQLISVKTNHQVACYLWPQH